MASHFPGYTKIFLTLKLKTPILDEKIRGLLNNKQPKYNQHITLMVLHIKDGSSVLGWVKETTFDVSMFNHLSTTNWHYDIMGQNPECLCLVFDTDYEPLIKFRSGVIELMATKFNLTPTDITIEYPDKITAAYSSASYTDYISNNVPIVRVSNNPVTTHKFHITLLTSFELKKYNKKVYKEYSKLKDKDEAITKSQRLAYLASSIGTIHDSHELDFENTVTVSYK